MVGERFRFILLMGPGFQLRCTYLVISEAFQNHHVVYIHEASLLCSVDRQYVEENEGLRAELDEWSVRTTKVSRLNSHINSRNRIVQTFVHLAAFHVQYYISLICNAHLQTESSNISTRL